MAKEIKNSGASGRARLLKLSKANGQSFDLVLTRFALERLLFRLSQSPHADRFVLKGAMLMMSWFDDPHRGTRDLDLLGFGDPRSEEHTSELQSLMRISYAVFCLNKKTKHTTLQSNHNINTRSHLHKCYQ